MNAYLVGALTIALISTGIALTILKRFKPVQRGIVAVACGYMTVQFAAEPITQEVGYTEVYSTLWFFTLMVILSCVYFFFFTQHGFVLGTIFKNHVPLIQPITGSPPINDPSFSPPIRRTVELNTEGARTVWEL